MTCFGSVYYARKFVRDNHLAGVTYSRCQDGLYRVFLDTGFRVDATRTTCASINKRFGKKLRFRLERSSGSYQILTDIDNMERVTVRLKNYRGEGCNCIWQESKNSIKSQADG